MARGYCSSFLSTTWRIRAPHSFQTRFSRAILEAFRYSKWVMQHTVGKPQMFSFQWYKVYTKQSSDGKGMAPGSWGVWDVFSRFSGEDSSQTGEATGELRVASCSWSFSLSNAPRLVDQLAVSRKEFAREGDCPGGKTRQIFSVFSLFFVCVRVHGWPSSRCRFSAFLVPLERFCCLLSKGSGLVGNRARVGEIRFCEQRPPKCFWSVGGHFFDRDSD
jgi:hypothetical protein